MTENKRPGSSPVLAAFQAIDGAVGNLVQGLLAAPGNLISELDRFRAVREKTLSMLEGLSAAQASWSPRPGAWSIAQIADHLLLSDELYKKQFRRLIEIAREGRSTSIRIDLREIDNSVAGIPRDVMRLFETPVRMFNKLLPNAARETLIRYPVVPALNPGASQPRSGLSIDKLRTDLAAELADTERLLREPMPANIEGPTIDHPILGTNNLRQLLRIVIVHEERHHGQIENIQTQRGFPAAGPSN